MANGTPLELIAVEVRADLDQLERGMNGAVRVVDQSMGGVERSVIRAERRVVQSAGAMANAQRNLGRQFADVGAQLSSGSSPFMILAQQAPQVADALADTGGKAARVAAFFAGPWGAALLAAASVVGVLVGKLFEAGDAAEKTKPSIDRLANAYATLIANLGRVDKAGAEALGVASVKLRTDQAALTRETDALRVAEERLAASRRVDPSGRGSAPLQRDVADAKARVASIKQEIETGQNLLKLGEQRFKQTGDLDRAEAEEAASARAATQARRGQAAARREHAAAEREAAKATRELERAQRELEGSLRAITSAFDPAKAAAIGFRDTIKEIDKLEAAGLLSSIDAITYKLKAAREQAAAIAEQAAKDSEAGFLAVGIRPGEMDGSEVQDQINRDIELRQAANDKVDEDFRRKQEASIRNLAGLYESLFREGTDGVWRDFKAIGIRVIAETLARFATSRIYGTGGGIGDFIGGALGSVLGFAGGGTGVFGGRGGTDKNVLSLNGQPIANVSRGEPFAIGTRAAAGRSGGGTVVQPIIQVDARGAVMNDQFASMILSQANQTAGQLVTAMGKGVLKAVPTRLSSYDTDGI